MVQRFLTICLFAAVLIGAVSCSRREDKPQVVDLGRRVREIQQESDRRRPAYRELVVDLYPAIANERAREWKIDWSRGEAPSGD